MLADALATSGARTSVGMVFAGKAGIYRLQNPKSQCFSNVGSASRWW